MFKYIFGILFSFNCFASISINTSQDILDQLTSVNGTQRIIIKVLNDDQINAYGGNGQVFVTKGLLGFGNKEMLTFILAHELSHAKGMRSETGADVESVAFTKKAGLDACPGARQFLLTVGKMGGNRHPPGITRLKLMKCWP